MILQIFSIIFSFYVSATPQQYGRFFISAQPTDQELTDFKKKTGAVVVDLREFDELGTCSEPVTTTKLGMRYERVQFAKKGKIDDTLIKAIEEKVETAKDKPVLVFCKSGNRAAAWLAIHLVKKEKKSFDEAVTIARTMGLKPDMEQRVRDYLK